MTNGDFRKGVDEAAANGGRWFIRVWRHPAVVIFVLASLFTALGAAATFSFSAQNFLDTKYVARRLSDPVIRASDFERLKQSVAGDIGELKEEVEELHDGVAEVRLNQIRDQLYQLQRDIDSHDNMTPRDEQYIRALRLRCRGLEIRLQAVASPVCDGGQGPRP